MSFADARALEKNIDAKLKWVELQKKLGSLLDRDEVVTAIENLYRVHREGILNIPSRIAAQVADLTESSEIEHVIADEIRASLEELSTALERIAPEKTR